MIINIDICTHMTYNCIGRQPKENFIKFQVEIDVELLVFCVSTHAFLICCFIWRLWFDLKKHDKKFLLTKTSVDYFRYGWQGHNDVLSLKCL